VLVLLQPRVRAPYDCCRVHHRPLPRPLSTSTSSHNRSSILRSKNAISPPPLLTPSHALHELSTMPSPPPPHLATPRSCNGVWCAMVCGVQWYVVCNGVRCKMVCGVQWCVVCNGMRQHAARHSKSAMGVCDKQQEHLVDSAFLREAH
jgi:hypothetical protein